MSALNIAVIIGSTRPNRFGDKPAKWIARVAAELPNVEVEILDLVDYPMPFFEEPAGPAYLNKQYSSDVVKKWSAKIDSADAFIVVTPEYNHSTSAVLKNAFDHLYPEWNNKPIAFIGYGSVGGGRAVEHLRQIAVELEMAPIRVAVHIPGAVHFPILFGQAEWTSETESKFSEKADEMLKQLLWWTKALKTAREG